MPNKRKGAQRTEADVGRPIRKRDPIGFHGTLFYGLQRYGDLVRERKGEDAVDPTGISQERRRLFGIG